MCLSTCTCLHYCGTWCVWCVCVFMPMMMYSVWCRPGVHWWSIHIASSVVWIRQLSGASLDLSHSDLVRYRCYKRKSVGAHPVHLQKNLWVHIQCICRFACFSCDGRIHGTWCVCACSLLEFFEKMKRWVEMALKHGLAKEVPTLVDNLEHRFRVITLIYRKYEDLFDTVFATPSEESRRKTR